MARQRVSFNVPPFCLNPADQTYLCCASGSVATLCLPVHPADEAYFCIYRMCVLVALIMSFQTHLTNSIFGFAVCESLDTMCLFCTANLTLWLYRKQVAVVSYTI